MFKRILNLFRRPTVDVTPVMPERIVQSTVESLRAKDRKHPIVLTADADGLAVPHRRGQPLPRIPATYQPRWSRRVIEKRALRRQGYFRSCVSGTKGSIFRADVS